MVSKALSSAPPRRMAWSRAAANRDSVSSCRHPGRPAAASRGRTSAEGPVGDGRGPLHPGHLAGVLDHPQASTRPRVGTSATGGEELVPRRAGRPGHVVGLQTERRRHPRPGRPAPRAGPARRRCTTSTSSPTPAAGSCSADWVRYRPSVVNRAPSAVTSSSPAEPLNPVSHRMLAGVVTSRPPPAPVRRRRRRRRAARSRSEAARTPPGAPGPRPSPRRSRPFRRPAARSRWTASTARR